MKLTLRKHSKIEDILIYILAALVILNHSVYYYMDSSKEVLQYALSIYPIFLLVILMHARGWKIDRRVGRVFLYTLFFGVLILCFNTSSGVAVISRYIVYVPCISIALSEYEKNCKYKFFFAYSNLMIVVAMVSLFFWVFASVMGLIQSSNIVPTSWGMSLGEYDKAGRSYGGVYFEMQYILGSLKEIFHYRNCAIFCEGPAYAFMLSLALLTEWVLREKVKLWKVALLSITLLSTCSAMGVLYIVLIFMLHWLITGRVSTKKMLIPIILVFFCAVVSIVIQNKANTTSVSIRLNDYLYALGMFVKSPIFGYGIDYASGIKELVGITNSFSSILMQGGLMMTIYYLAPLILMIIPYLRFYKPNIGSKEEIGKSMAVGVWAIFAIISTILTQTFILLSILAFCYKETMAVNNGKTGRTKDAITY